MIFKRAWYNRIPMGLVTKKGDNGKTSLYMGGRVAKDNPRIELVGALDELSAFLGAAKGVARSKALKDSLTEIQKDLVRLGTEAATPAKAVPRLTRRICRDDVV